MPRLVCLFAVLLIAPCCAQAADDVHWLQDYKGQGTDDVLGDKRFKPFLADEVPTFEVDLGFGPHGIKTGLKVALMEVLGGPPDTVIAPDDHSVVLSACRTGSCNEKGFIWIDTAGKQSVLAIIHYIYSGAYSDKPQLFMASNDFTCGLYPQGAIEQIKFWLHQNQITPATVRCLDGSKVAETIL